jgi:hypothetical protein
MVSNDGLEAYPKDAGALAQSLLCVTIRDITYMKVAVDQLLEIRTGTNVMVHVEPGKHVQ